MSKTIKNLSESLKVATKRSGPAGLINIVFSLAMIILGIYTMLIVSKVDNIIKIAAILLILFSVLVCLQVNYRFSKKLYYKNKTEKNKNN